ncbi:adenylate kinase family protein [Blattabacterium cuenoti]|uniref:adenylate kinase family protein n=1 Tax=Blattabacterium cuenoti TaxID=1653831 RepID=UPI00163C8F44|nr:nucleoside monophosphate kinase [Blattabacterium cuenoti]
MINIVLFGPPGCGKGTQAKIIENNFRFIHLSTGIIFRDHIKRKTSLGKNVSFYVNQGKLVPDIITNNIISLEIKKNLNASGFIYDGYPRTKEQIIFLKTILNKLSMGKINIIFYFVINKDIIINRLLKRKITENRKDDINIKIIENRIKEYDKEISLIWKNLELGKKIIMLDANFSIEKLSFFIKKEIYTLLNTKYY